jgi:hypothetical protein
LVQLAMWRNWISFSPSPIERAVLPAAAPSAVAAAQDEVVDDQRERRVPLVRRRCC